jgi:hypothetical protein
MCTNFGSYAAALIVSIGILLSRVVGKRVYIGSSAKVCGISSSVEMSLERQARLEEFVSRFETKHLRRLVEDAIKLIVGIFEKYGCAPFCLTQIAVAVVCRNRSALGRAVTTSRYDICLPQSGATLE